MGIILQYLHPPFDVLIVIMLAFVIHKGMMIGSSLSNQLNKIHDTIMAEIKIDRVQNKATHEAMQSEIDAQNAKHLYYDSVIKEFKVMCHKQQDRYISTPYYEEK